MKYAVVTFGCRVNQADSLEIEGQLRRRGASDAPVELADLVVVNTCSVTASADQGARQAIRRIAGRNPGARIVVTGCYATRRPDELRELPQVARVVPNADKDALVHLLCREAPALFLGRHHEPRTTAERFGDGDGECGATLAPGVAGRTALTLRVQTGCDERCSYCIIPRTRGPGRSRPLPDVLRDVGRAITAGYKEITVTGVHLGSYGRDRADGSSLSTLVRALAEEPADVLFRLSSLEPMDCAPEIIDLMAGSPRLAPHFHLPLQHGSDGVLRAMRRPYTSGFYRDLVERIHAAIPGVAIGADVIVGFPGETEADARDTRALLEQLPLAYLHVFPYSDRQGTEASRLALKVDGAAIRERGREVRAIGARLAERFRRSQIGRTVRGLTVDDGQSVVTGNYLKLRLDRARSRNEWVTVKVVSEHEAVEATPWALSLVP